MKSLEDPTPAAERAEDPVLREKIEELRAELDRARKEAVTDEMTGAYNRRGFKEKILEGRGRERRRATAILIVDVDNFKMINDAYGHDAGDAAVAAAADFLRANTRSRDTVSRWGGDEFVVAFSGAEAQDIINKFYEPENSARPMEDRRSKISIPVELGGQKTFVTLSGGITTMREGESLEEAVARADRALYRAKEAGKNRLESADEEGPRSAAAAPAETSG